MLRAFVVCLLLIGSAFGSTDLATAFEKFLQDIRDTFSENNPVVKKFQDNINQFGTAVLTEIEDTVSDYAENLLDKVHTPEDILWDQYHTTPQIIKKYGYPSEIHTVQTYDGYVLEIHRIPNPGGIPVYLQHGLLDSSVSWIIMGPKTAFAYMLHDLGYDVWMGNNRGNRYSRRHIMLNPKDDEFWNFSFHEIGLYDIPASIDYILEKTNHKKLHYVGHSQGTSTFWVMCSERPEYCGKIISMQALAPVAFLENVDSNTIQFMSRLLKEKSDTKFNGEIMTNNLISKLMSGITCNEDAITQPLCIMPMFLVTGYNMDLLNKTMLPVILGHFPAGGSMKQLVHFSQLVSSGKFVKFDFLEDNFRIYGQKYPPAYNFSKVTTPVALYYSTNDLIATPADVNHLRKTLPNVFRTYLVPDERFHHIDFLLAMNSRDMVHKMVVKTMKDIEERKPMDYLTFLRLLFKSIF